MQLNCVITSWLVVTYDKIMTLKKIITTYLDVTNDCILLGAVVATIDSILFGQFQFQVALILLMSIIIPMLVSATMIAFTHPFVVLRALPWKKLSTSHSTLQLVLIRTITIIGFLFVPALLIVGKDEAIEQRKSLKGKRTKIEDLVKPSVLENCQILTDYINASSSALLTYKKNELSLELIPQLSINLTMLLLSITKYPVQSGLQSIFQDKKETSNPSFWIVQLGLQEFAKTIDESENATIGFFIFSVIWSLKSCAKTSVMIKAEAKSFLPLPAKMLLYLRYIVLYPIRIGVYVAFFSASIGLLGVLNHYHAEISKFLDPDIWCNDNTTTGGQQLFHYWDSTTDQFQSVKVADIFQSTYSCSEGKSPQFLEVPPTTLYTVISFGQAYGLFLGFYVIYGLILTWIKNCMNNDFKMSPKGEKIQHILMTLHCPEAFGDWDSDHDLDVAGHLKKWKSILKESLVMILMQCLSNLILLVPLFVTGKLVCIIFPTWGHLYYIK